MHPRRSERDPEKHLALIGSMPCSALVSSVRLLFGFLSTGAEAVCLYHIV